MKWFREAKYGLFIHWGLYAIPAGEWKGKPIAGIGEWIMNRAQDPGRRSTSSSPTQFNPVEVQRRRVGAAGEGRRHEVHRDHVASTTTASRMFKSKASTYNIVDATPFKRDVAEGARRRVRAPRHARSASTTRSRRTGTSRTAPATPGTSAPTTKKDYDQYLRGKAEPQVQGAAHRLRPGRADLVRHAAHDDRRARRSASPTSCARCSPTR